ncbi:hypothetical protein V6N11_003424 [Hibiscus sabdariffa]|uniref:Erythronate-4-phosphate dehydrogenase family protein n=1 Tax=Hibiscus sabdariffa TaxID=183260 RepID=A0ABR2SDU7_9ROSI
MAQQATATLTHLLVTPHSARKAGRGRTGTTKAGAVYNILRLQVSRSFGVFAYYLRSPVEAAGFYRQFNTNFCGSSAVVVLIDVRGIQRGLSSSIMEGLCETPENGKVADGDLNLVRYSPLQPCAGLSSLWFDMRVFYVRVSKFQVDDSTPEFLTLSHIPLEPDTLLEVNGIRSSTYSDEVSILLRRDRVDKRSEEVTFVSTDNVKLTGSVKFEVFDKKDLIISGVLEMSGNNGFIGESKNNVKQWSMNCESEITSGGGFLKGKHNSCPKLSPPTIEVYVAGCFSGKPIILTKTLQLNYRKKHNRKGALDAIPEYESTECQKDTSPGYMQLSEYRNYKQVNDEDYNNIFWRRTEYMDNEDGELSWFNAGVRVGVGIGLGVCLGVGIGVGLLVRTYQATTRSFKRRLI